MVRRRPAALAAALLMLILSAGCSAASPGAESQLPPTIAPAAGAAPAPAAELAPPTATAASATAVAQPAPSPAPAATEPAAPEAAAGAQPDAGALGRTLALQEPRLTGDDVRQAQERLLALGYTQLGAADGIFGPNTERAVRAFQGANGLDVDGVIGPQTWSRLWDEQARGAVLPIVYAASGFLLGGVRAGRWIDAETTRAALIGGEQYQLYSALAASGHAVGGAPESAGVPCEETVVVPLTPAASEDDLLALGGAWNPLPRVAEDASDEAVRYHDAVAAMLRDQGVDEPEVQIQHVLRADLDGDGAQETLVSAERLAAERTTIEAGDYSLVALIRADDPSRAVLVVGESYTEAAEFGASASHTVAGLLDLNGDGVLDIVVNWEYYEGAGTVVYDVASGEPREVLGAGCGV